MTQVKPFQRRLQVLEHFVAGGSYNSLPADLQRAYLSVGFDLIPDSDPDKAPGLTRKGEAELERLREKFK